FGGLATILQNWISCNEQKMREAHITRRGTSFYLLIFIEKSSTVKLNTAFWLFLWDFKGKSINHFQRAGMFFHSPQRGFLWIFLPAALPFRFHSPQRGLRRGKPAWTGLWPCGSRRTGNHQGKPRADGSMTAFYFSSPISR
ncbi:hypothetical protein, partial [Bilophila sp.]|uniref:hypothetical protein n=1 Tax=Bilophila sp. TaxID=1929485 RepID=UPI003076A885